MFTIDEINKGVCFQVTLRGKLDTAANDEFKRRFAEWPVNEKIILDVSELEYISSSGLRSLIQLKKNCMGASGDLSICGAGGIVQSVFNISGIGNIITLYSSMDEAISQSE